MHTIIRLLAILIASLFKSRRQLEAEILYAAQTAVEGLLAFTRLVRANLMHRRPIDHLCQRRSKIASASRSKNAWRTGFGALVDRHMARMTDLLGSAERSSPAAAQRRARGAGLDGESAHRAIILVAEQARFMAEAVAGLLRDKTRKPGKAPLPPVR